jgi:hypothetical protein
MNTFSMAYNTPKEGAGNVASSLEWAPENIKAGNLGNSITWTI